MLLRERFDKLIPKRREIIIRSQGRMRYIGMGRTVQFVLILMALTAMSWSTYATGRFIVHNSIMIAQRSTIDALRDENETLATDLSVTRNRVAIQELSLTATQKSTVDLVANNQNLQFKVSGLEKELEAHATQGQAFALFYLGEVEAHARMGAEARQLEDVQVELKRRLDEREKRLMTLDADRSRLGKEVVNANAAVLSLKQEIGTLNFARVDLINRLETSNERLQSEVKAKQHVDGERDDLGAQVVELSERLETTETAQLDIVARLGEQAGASGDALKRTLSITGLDVDRLLGRLSRSDENARGVGGPLLALDNLPGSNLAHQIAAVEQRIDDYQRLQDLMERLPLAAPLDEFRLTSSYGRRIDPFTSRFALHSGIDMASRRRASVHVTSPGVVTFVGWKGGFGKFVEVDHGLGIRTRYAHLSNIYVKRGQTLEFREKVGQIGSTGRSSGEHLHYEVIVDGRSQNPSSFIKAGQYVFKK